jgi:hypothetical protein
MFTFSQLGSYGRLGNQMWQIASTIGLAHNLNTSFGFPKWKYASQFHVNFTEVEDTTGYKLYEETEPYYNPPFLNIRENWDLRGYFQSWKYFMNDQGFIHSVFNFGDREPLDFVSIHVRRGDYLNYSHVHTNLSRTDYYEKAINLFSKKTEFIVFTDDVQWCEEKFYNREDGARFIVTRGGSDFDNMKLMSSCKGHIIANSSFSWWAAYLSFYYNNKVVYPSKWVNTEDRNDRIPNNPAWEEVQI